jgi:glycosyltransferase involved in cell wall biosynthesis
MFRRIAGGRYRELATRSSENAQDEKYLAQMRPYFDAVYYLKEYPDVAAAGVEPLEHYYQHGWREGRNPNPDFNSNFYLNHNSIWVTKPVCPLLHYINEGQALQLPTNERETLRTASPHSILDVLRSIEQIDLLTQSPLDDKFNQDLLISMFSPSFYIEATNQHGLTDAEAFLRYLLIDLEQGVAPGPLFINEFYVQQARKLALPAVGKSPFLHWLDHGVRRNVSPHPLYSDETYLSLNKDLTGPEPWPRWPFLHFVKHGVLEERRIHPMLAVERSATSGLSSVKQSPIGGVLEKLALNPDSLSEISEMDGFRESPLFEQLMREAQTLEPEVGGSAVVRASHVPPLFHGSYRDFSEILKLLPQGEFQAVIFMPFCKMGGADFIAGCLAHALASQHKVLILRTEQSDWFGAHWFPDDIPTVDISEHLRVLHPSDRVLVLYRLIEFLGPQHVFNVNSRTCFELYDRFGSRLKTFTNTYAYYFCSDRTIDGVEVGYPVEYFSNVITHLTAAFVDNASLAQALIDRYLLPKQIAEKVVVAYTPSMSGIPRVPMVTAQVASRDKRHRPLILWAGRFDRQKRFDLFKEIASNLPQVDFMCWGRAVLDEEPPTDNLPDNLKVFAPFTDIHELPLEACDGWLYTSAWDGLPTILIECGGMGMPIVASRVGGVEELISEDTGWLVADADDTECYVAVLREMLDSPSERIRRASRLREVVSERHTMKNYRDTIAAAMMITVGEKRVEE